jgi:hypothetical protein
MGRFLLGSCIGTVCGTKMFAVVTDRTIPCCLTRQYRPVLSPSSLDVYEINIDINQGLCHRQGLGLGQYS